MGASDHKAGQPQGQPHGPLEWRSEGEEHERGRYEQERSRGKARLPQRPQLRGVAAGFPQERVTAAPVDDLRGELDHEQHRHERAPRLDTGGAHDRQGDERARGRQGQREADARHQPSPSRPSAGPQCGHRRPFRNRRSPAVDRATRAARPGARPGCCTRPAGSATRQLPSARAVARASCAGRSTSDSER